MVVSKWIDSFHQKVELIREIELLLFSLPNTFVFL